jgi:hypothetical protein
MESLDKKDMRIPRGCKFYEKGLEGVNMPEKNLFTLGTILQEYGHSTVKSFKVFNDFNEIYRLNFHSYQLYF